MNLTSMMIYDFKEFVKFCREAGVVSASINGIGSFTFGTALVDSDPRADKPPEGSSTKEAMREKKLGKDGLTAEQQIELFGQVVDAEN